jgi:hypothetical protein
VKRPAQVWLALSRGEPQVSTAAAVSKTPFAVRVQIRPPQGSQLPISSELVKEVFDGVICAFQAHTDQTILPQVAERLAITLPADPEEIATHLLDQRQAVLGVVPRLVYPYRKSVKWDPADNWCLAGELLRADPVDRRWAIKGDIVELSR